VLLQQCALRHCVVVSEYGATRCFLAVDEVKHTVNKYTIYAS